MNGEFVGEDSEEVKAVTKLQNVRGDIESAKIRQKGNVFLEEVKQKNAVELEKLKHDNILAEIDALKKAKISMFISR